ncbi:MAG: septum formation initiator family protein [Anaerovoracaceae bacterium]
MAKDRLSRSQRYVKKAVENPVEAASDREKRREKREADLIRKKEKEVQKKPASKRRKLKASRKRLVYLVIILSLIALVAIKVENIHSLIKERQELTAYKYVLMKEKAALNEEMNNVKSKEYVEQQARAQLRLVRPGEILYIFPEKEKDLEEDN